MQYQSHRFCVAPMMEWTDRHCRFFHRLLSKRARLYTEMVAAEAVLHGDSKRLLGFSNAEHPVALQLGSCKPLRLAAAARIGADEGYDEINLNVGCPSNRVQAGRFGACLMAEPELVGECVSAMQAAVNIPVTVKCRIGINDQDGEEDFAHFIEVVSAAGCNVFIVHARKAWLKGLSPKENRDIPPLDYGRVYRLKASRPDLKIVLNGGVSSHDAVQAHLRLVDGVMLGRAAYETPYLLAEVDQLYFGVKSLSCSREAIMYEMLDYAAAHIARGGRLNNVMRHMLGLYHGQPGARAFRRHLTNNAMTENTDVLIGAIRSMYKRSGLRL